MHLVARVEQVLDDTGAHDAQAEHAEAQLRGLDVLLLQGGRRLLHVQRWRLLAGVFVTERVTSQSFESTAANFRILYFCQFIFLRIVALFL